MNDQMDFFVLLPGCIMLLEIMNLQQVLADEFQAGI
jgi:hypothetical protein